MKTNHVDGAIEPMGDAIRMCRDYVVHQFVSVQDNELYVCGMQPFDGDELMYGVIGGQAPWSLSTTTIPS